MKRERGRGLPMHSKVEQPKTKKETPKDVKGKPET
jgi:hypothetical protein